MTELQDDLFDLELPSLNRKISIGPEEIVGGRVLCLVKDHHQRRFYRTSPNAAFVLLRLDGVRRAPEIADEYREQFGRAITRSSMESLVESLARTGMFEWPAPGGGSVHGEGGAVAGPPSLFTIKVWHWNPEHWLARIVPSAAALVSAPALLALALVILFFQVLVVSDLSSIWSSTVAASTSTIPGRLAIIALIQIVMSIAHELAHAIACTARGGEVTEIGLMVRYLFPSAYTRIDDILMFPRRLDRICVLLAGPLVSLSVVPIALIAWTISSADSLVHVVSADFLIWYNLNCLVQFLPFVKLDGYFMLAQALRMPSLMADSYAYIFGGITPRFMRLKRVVISPECPAYVRPALVIYGCASFLVTVTALTYAVSMYRGVLTKVFGESVGLVLVVLGLAALTVTFLVKWWQWNRPRST